jgi:hypothetical protein
MIALTLFALAVQAADVTLAEENPQLVLSVSWPAAADAIAPLSAHLRRDARARGRRATAVGRQAEAQARRGRYPFAQHSLTITWQVEGSTPQLFSLSAVTSAYTGGGHGSDDFDALLWDRSTDRPVDPYRLFPSLGTRFCAAYPEALAAHGGAPSANQEQCPGLERRPLSPADRDGNGRFETLRAFVATGYFDAEGFSVDIPVEPTDIAGLSDHYRPAFEVLGERRTPLPGQ